VAGAAEPVAVRATLTGANTRFSIAIYEFSGVNTTINKTNSQSDLVSPFTNPTTMVSVIPTKAPNLVIAAVSAGAAGNTIATWGALTNSFIETNDLISSGNGGTIDVDAGYKINAALGTVDTQSTYSDTTQYVTGWRAAMISFNSAAPTAADSAVSGTITDSQGTPLSGAVVRLSGTQSRKTITDANGNYHFDNVETAGFYTVAPSRANYSFSAANRSFSQLGNQTEAGFTGSSTGDAVNPLDTPEYFVRQQYVDVLGREPDEGGFNYWSDQILACSGDVDCTRSRLVSVAVAFFIEQEFQQTGLYIYDVYSSALGRRPAFTEYLSDRQQVVGGGNLELEKMAFAESIVQRAEFATTYQANTTAESFVEAMIQSVQTSGIDLSGARDILIATYNSGSSIDASRGAVVRTIADNVTFRQSQYNQAFVLTEYFAYLRRDAEPDGYNFWMNVLNNSGGGDPGNYRGMVCSFVTSAEYQQRFSTVVTQTNGKCSGQ
jgi:hypothetical protein